MKRTLCLWFPRWPIQRILIEQPELHGRGLIVYVNTACQAQQVLVCDAVAEALGVCAGMPLSEAASLAGRQRRVCHQQLHDPHADRATLETLALRCEQFSPVASIEDAPQPESLLLDVTGLARLFGGEENLAQQALETLTAAGYHVRVALADTPCAAWAVAHFSAAEKQLTIVPPGEQEPLDSLPIEGLQLPPATSELLHRLGLVQIGDVARLSRASLKSRFGPEIGLRLDQLFGTRQELLVAHRRAPDFQETWTGEHPTTSSAAVEQIFQHLLHRLALSLSAKQQGALEVTGRLTLEHAPSLVLRVNLYQPSADAGTFEELLQMQLERQRITGAVTEITMTATRTAALTWRQGELFEGLAPQASRPLADLVNRLTSRLGRERVVRAQIKPSAVPEASCTYASWVEARAGRRQSLGFKSLDRPLWLLAKPVPLCVSEFTATGLPAAFWYEQTLCTITRHGLPERIESAWWRGRMVRRDYYRITTDTGQRFWLFQRLYDQRWFLHGEFA